MKLAAPILIVGKNGQVGYELQRCAGRQNLETICLGSTELDIRDERAVLATICDVNPSVVINAAAYTAVDRAEEDLEGAFKVNRDGVENLAKACKHQNIPLIHISTDYVFDGSASIPYRESDKTCPLGVYGQSKLAGEVVLKDVWEKHIVLRVSWVFGIHGNNFVKTMIRLASSHSELSVVDDQLGTPTSAKSIATILLQIVTSAGFGENSFPWGIYHYSGGRIVSWYGFASEIFKRAASKSLIDKETSVKPVGTEDYPTPAARPKYSVMDNRLLMSTFAIEASDWQLDLDSMLDELLLDKS